CAAGAARAVDDDPAVEFLLFTDADVAHAPWSLGRTAAALQAADADLLSVVPTHRLVAPWEFFQGVFHVLVLTATAADADLVAPGVKPLAANAARADERHFSIGQYLLFRRQMYDAVGGHPAVRRRVAEDIAFCRMVLAAGGRFSLVYAPGLLVVRMYPEGLTAFVNGWRRNFREGLAAAGVVGSLETAAVMTWLLGVPLNIATAVAEGNQPAAIVFAAVYVATAWEVHRKQRLVGPFPWWSAAFYPIFAGLFALAAMLAVFDAAARRPVFWRGRRTKV
ncbi:MAG: glycosyltransferase, partial [Planctomycetia bacterium]